MKRIVDIEIVEVVYGTALVHWCFRLDDDSRVCRCDDGGTIINRDYYVGKELRFLPDGSYVVCN